MFYDTYLALCKKAGEKPYSVPLVLGAKTNACVDQWKKGSVPRQPMLEKIAEHFGVTIDYLLTGEQKQPAGSGELSKEETSMLDAFRTLPQQERALVMRLLRSYASTTEQDQAAHEGSE